MARLITFDDDDKNDNNIYIDVMTQDISRRTLFYQVIIAKGNIIEGVEAKE